MTMPMVCGQRAGLSKRTGYRKEIMPLPEGRQEPRALFKVALLKTRPPTHSLFASMPSNNNFGFSWMVVTSS
jgi:hypothetical protein